MEIVVSVTENVTGGSGGVVEMVVCATDGTVAVVACSEMPEEPLPTTLAKEPLPTTLAEEPLPTTLAEEPLPTTLAEEPLPTTLAVELRDRTHFPLTQGNGSEQSLSLLQLAPIG